MKKVSLLLYADDIVLIAESPDGMQKQLDALHKFAEDSGLSVSLGKTKVVVFNTTPQWVRRSAPKFAYGQDIVEYTDTYTYLGVVFTGPKFTLKKAADIQSVCGIRRVREDVFTRSVPRTKNKTLALRYLGDFNYALRGPDLETICGSR